MATAKQMDRERQRERESVSEREKERLHVIKTFVQLPYQYFLSTDVFTLWQIDVVDDMQKPKQNKAK